MNKKIIAGLCLAFAILNKNPLHGQVLKNDINPASTLMDKPYYSKPFSKSCPPIVWPVIGYTYQGQIKSGIMGGVHVLSAYPKCDCTSGLSLCYFVGFGYGANITYYPSAKLTDLSASLEYRWLFLFAGISPGYSFASSNSNFKSFFHGDFSAGLELYIGQISGGYSARTETFGNQKGAGFFKITLNPAVFTAKNRARLNLGKALKIKKDERRRMLNGGQ